MYDNHAVYVRVSDGLLQPIRTTIGLKQGCGISPLLFNLIIDKITSIFDNSCDPANVNGEDLSCLLWADDLILFTKCNQQNTLVLYKSWPTNEYQKKRFQPKGYKAKQ